MWASFREQLAQHDKIEYDRRVSLLGIFRNKHFRWECLCATSNSSNVAFKCALHFDCVECKMQTTRPNIPQWSWSLSHWIGLTRAAVELLHFGQRRKHSLWHTVNNLCTWHGWGFFRIQMKKLQLICVNYNLPMLAANLVVGSNHAHTYLTCVRTQLHKWHDEM